MGATEDAVVSSCGIEVCPWELFGDPKEFDYVVVVGGLVYGHEKQHLKGLEFLYRAHEQGVGLVGLCTGSFLIAEMGLLDGRRCAVHFRHQEEFKALYPKVNVVTDELFVEDNGIFTCPGGTAAVDVAVELIAREAGPARAMKALPDLVVVQRRMGVQPPPKSNDVPLYCDDERVEQAIKTMQSHLSKPKTTSDLAEMVGLGVAQFNRIFFQHVDRVPQEYYRLLRLKHARWRLLNSRRSVAEIAKECGFSDSAHMGRWFKREFGTPPGQFRKAARPGNGNGRHR
ncbi:helix-turn-helix domain-containing protein [Parvibaculum lavamentivorans]|nr:helix-turn-helix domain-containing protein [Parvibaculum lavamentivorans]